MALSRNVARTCIATSARGDAPLRHFELPYAASSEFPSVVLSEFNTVLSSAIDTPPYCPPNSNDGKPSSLHKLNDKCPVWRFASRSSQSFAKLLDRDAFFDLDQLCIRAVEKEVCNTILSSQNPADGTFPTGFDRFDQISTDVS